MNTCPSCKSSQVNISYPIIQCLKCGLREDLEDYAIGAMMTKQATIIEALQDIQPYKVEPLPPNAFQELSARFNHLQNQYNQHIDPARKIKNEKL